MVSQRRNREKRSVAQVQVAALLTRNDLKAKKKVTWDKAIALREEELVELEKEGAPIVIFVDQVDTTEGAEAQLQRVGTEMRFCLENGRVDVSEVLGRLGVSQLDCELQPGVWRPLERLDSGKSISKFKSGQRVPIRIMPGSSPDIAEESIVCRTINSRDAASSSSAVVITAPPEGSLLNPLIRGKMLPWIDKWIVEGDTQENYYNRVSRLIEDRSNQGGGLCGIGVVLRLAFHQKHTRLLVTCRHMVAQTHPDTRGQLYAFGGPVQILYISMKYDLALLQGPPLRGHEQQAFALAPEGEEQVGREVRLLTFPWYLDNVWGQRPLKDVQASQMSGHIASLGSRQQSPDDRPIIVDALATYMGGLPGCSGGAVTLNSKMLCGVHSGVHPFRLHELHPHAISTMSNEPLSERCGETTSESKTPQLAKCANKRKFEAFLPSTRFNPCTSTHGYLAVYVSSSHIRETCLEWYTKPQIKRILNRS